MKGDQFYLQHLRDCIAAVESYTQEGGDHFLQTRLVQDAVIRNFEIIGEAAKRLSESFRASHPEIPWKQIIGFRNLLIHDYLGVNPKTVWETIVSDLPKLKRLVVSSLSPITRP